MFGCVGPVAQQQHRKEWEFAGTDSSSSLLDEEEGWALPASLPRPPPLWPKSSESYPEEGDTIPSAHVGMWGG